ncbi:EGF-like protein [Fowlpox virus]|nr:EGF-like protein [Fowlpox virus]
MDDFINPIKKKKEYTLFRNLLDNKPTISVSIIIILLICNIAFYSYRLNQLLIIKRNFESHISSIVKDSNSYTSFGRIDTKLFKKCKNDYSSYCINGVCRYIVDLSEVVCVCNRGYSGTRCEVQSIM